MQVFNIIFGDKLLLLFSDLILRTKENKKDKQRNKIKMV